MLLHRITSLLAVLVAAAALGLSAVLIALSRLHGRRE